MALSLLSQFQECERGEKYRFQTSANPDRKKAKPPAVTCEIEKDGRSEGEGAQDAFKGNMHSVVYLALVIPSILH